MASKQDRESAYTAGRHAFTTEPPDRRSVSACPFPEGDERQKWLQGFQDALEEQPSDTDLRRELRKELDQA